MMMHYSPLKLAEVFKTLSAFSQGELILVWDELLVAIQAPCTLYLKAVS